MVNARLVTIFENATDKQREVLELLCENRTSKEIGIALGITESAVTKRIESLRVRADNVSRKRLARSYQDWSPKTTCKNLTGKLNQVPEPDFYDDMPLSDISATPQAFVLETKAPWENTQQSIVREVFDGQNGTLTRTAAIIVIALGLLVIALIGFALALAITSL